MRQTTSNILLNTAVVVVTVAALIAVVGRVRASYFSNNADSSIEPVPVKEWRSFASGGALIGPADGIVTVIIFSDFQCPYCRDLAADLRTVRAERPGQIRVIYRHFPLRIHANARGAAFASMCAGQQGLFEAMHNELFLHQDSIGHAPWTWFADRSHVTRLNQFDACMRDSLALLPSLKRDSVDGLRLGVQGTPTFLINNLKVFGAPGLKRLEEYIASAEKASN